MIKDPISRRLPAVCLAGLLVTGLSLLLNYRTFTFYRRHLETSKEWFLIMISVHLIMLAGITLLYFKKPAGLWLYFAGVVAFFTVPAIGGTIDSLLGLLTPLYFIAFATLFVLLGKEYKKLVRL